jgi:RNA polymerase sigma-70 factor (ECF subfamily)
LLSHQIFYFPLKTRLIADCLAKPGLDTHLLLGARKKRRSPVTYASKATSFVGRTNAAGISKPLPVSRTRRRFVRSTSCESPSYEARTVVETRAEVIGREALEEMFLTSRPKFLAIALTILRNREDAEDAVQNAFLSGYLHLRSFEGRSALRTWFTRIVLNSALMIRRKCKPSTIQPLPENNNSREVNWTENIPALEPDPEMVHAERETFECINRILGKMNPVLRQAFTMTYYDELSGQEACAVLGVSAGTFKARLFRARRQVFHQTERILVAPIHKMPLSASEFLKCK